MCLSNALGGVNSMQQTLAWLVDRYVLLFTETIAFFQFNWTAFASKTIGESCGALFDDFALIAQRNPHWPCYALAVLLASMALTMLRHFSNRYIVHRGIFRFGYVEARNEVRVNEALFNLAFFTTSFLIAFRIVQSENLLDSSNNDHNQTAIIWGDHLPFQPIPFSFGLVYFLEISYYLHSLYATVFLNEWKKDSIVLFSHHIVALVLLVFSFLSGAHRVGVLVLYLHDVNDVIMESTKLLIKLKLPERASSWVELGKNIGFVAFFITWFHSRLYLFPIKAILPSAIFFNEASAEQRFPFMSLLFSLLYLILFMNIYWGYLILHTTFNALAGSEKLDDIREYDHEHPELKFRKSALGSNNQLDKMEEKKVN